MPAVLPLTPAEADALVRAGELTLVDVRPPEERALAAVSVPFTGLEDGGFGRLLSGDPARPLAFLCHHGVRSAQAAEYFRAHGFTTVYNVVGGIEAWTGVDPSLPRY